MQVIIDGRDINDIEQLHDKLEDELDFPEYYGRNLDALYDCLTDLHEPVEFLIIYKDELEEALGSYYDAFLCVLDDAMEEMENISVRIEE